MDEAGTNNWYKIDIENLVLSNMIKAVTHGSLPSLLDSDDLRIGFKQYAPDPQNQPHLSNPSDFT